jgi:hypothetical protein
MSQRRAFRKDKRQTERNGMDYANVKPPATGTSGGSAGPIHER